MEFTPRGEQVWISVRDEDRWRSTTRETLRPRSARCRRTSRAASSSPTARAHRADRTYDHGTCHVTQIERRLLNDFQHDFPLEPRPIDRYRRRAGLDATRTVLDRSGDLQARGAVSRIGAVVRPNTVGASTLAAMAVPPSAGDVVAALVSALSRGQPQLRARAPLQPLVRGHRRRTTRPARHAGAIWRERHSRSCAAAGSRTITSTSASACADRAGDSG